MTKKTYFIVDNHKSWGQSQHIFGSNLREAKLRQCSLLKPIPLTIYLFILGTPTHCSGGLRAPLDKSQPPSWVVRGPWRWCHISLRLLQQRLVVLGLAGHVTFRVIPNSVWGLSGMDLVILGWGWGLDWDGCMQGKHLNSWTISPQCLIKEHNNPLIKILSSVTTATCAEG